jgi:DNA-binding YbaB/EbfC family protein
MSFNLGNLMKQAQKFQQEMLKIQEELAKEVVEGTAAGSGVKVIANGQGEILQVKIPKEVVNPEDVEMLEDLILMATRDALKKAQDLSQEKLSRLTGGLKIPAGLF